MPAAAELKHRNVVKRVWLAAIVVGVVGGLFGALMMFGWMIDETHFDRPDAGFNRLITQIEGAPGVNIDAKERWVEAPTFSDPRSWIQLTVDEKRLPGLLSIACASDYGDPVNWSLRVATDTGSVVSLYTDAASDDRVENAPCPDFGFDAAEVVDEAGRSLPGLDLQAAIWDNGRFALVALEDAPGTLSEMLPLVGRAEAMRDAAGLDRRHSVEINAATLGVVIRPEEHDLYLALLSELAEEHGVTSFWSDSGGTPIDGVAKVQVAAPDNEHAAIENAIRTSGLHIADFPVRFIPTEP